MMLLLLCCGCRLWQVMLLFRFYDCSVSVVINDFGVVGLWW